MDIVRNNIKVSGISDGMDISANKNGQIIHYSENETILLPEDAPTIDKIKEIRVKIKITSSKRLRTPSGECIVLDGTKQLKVIYDSVSTNKTLVLNSKSPYNAFYELPEGLKKIEESVFIIDAFFQKLDERRIYSHLIYLINVNLENMKDDNFHKIQETYIEKKPLFITEKIKDELKNDHLENIENQDTKEKNFLVDIESEYL